MIQRIQTLYLLFSIVVGTLLFFIPVAVFSSASTVHPIFVTGIKSAALWYLLLVYLPCLVFPFYQIFLFKNRRKQLTMGKISVAIWVLWATFFVFVCYFMLSGIVGDGEFSPAFGAILPVIAILFIVLANKAIKKDEELVRSIDRIR